VSFILSQKDMEMSCDEKVISVFGHDIRNEYATSLIRLAVKQNRILNCGLLAFGESNIKSRIKGIMNFKKPGFWLGTVAIVFLIALGAMLLTNGQFDDPMLMRN
jgi:beta-lactamase regulating signal transducer with metallopeptidase domain